MKNLAVLSAIVLFIVLLPLMMIGCQQQPESSQTPSPPKPAPVLSEPEEEYVPDQIIVKFQPGTPIEAQEQLHQELGTTVIHTSPYAGFQVLQIPEGKTVPEMVILYSEKYIVEYAEPNYIEHISSESQ